jgi:peptide/nickel transport system permease protein
MFGVLLSATLVRLAPGFEVDEQQLDSRLNSESMQAIRSAKGKNKNIIRFYFHYFERAVHGDLGSSTLFNCPVRQLLAQRLPVTIRLVGSGLLFGWAVGSLLALATSVPSVRHYDIFATVTVAILMSVPGAVLALALFFFRAPGYLAIALLVVPKIFSYARSVLRNKFALPHITAAYAKGLGAVDIFLRHVLPVSAPELLTLAAVSLSTALGAAIPVEALCGIPGIGDLAWQAALGRDLLVLVNVTVVITVVTLVANSSSDLLIHKWGGHSA